MRYMYNSNASTNDLKLSCHQVVSCTFIMFLLCVCLLNIAHLLIMLYINKQLAQIFLVFAPPLYTWFTCSKLTTD